MCSRWTHPVRSSVWTCLSIETSVKPVQLTRLNVCTEAKPATLVSCVHPFKRSVWLNRSWFTWSSEMQWQPLKSKSKTVASGAMISTNVPAKLSVWTAPNIETWRSDEQYDKFSSWTCAKAATSSTKSQPERCTVWRSRKLETSDTLERSRKTVWSHAREWRASGDDICGSRNETLLRLSSVCNVGCWCQASIWRTLHPFKLSAKRELDASAAWSTMRKHRVSSRVWQCRSATTWVIW